MDSMKLEKRKSPDKKLTESASLKTKVNIHKPLLSGTGMSNNNSNNFHKHSKNYNLKTEGSFDSTSSCIFGNDVEIIELIGQGTFGKVFKGRMKTTGEQVAIKRVLQDKKYKNR